MIDAAANDALDALEACPCCLLGPQQRCLKTPYSHLNNTEIYSDMLKECFNIQLDVLSDKCGMCEECVVRLRNASHFKRQVQRSQEQLQERLTRALKIIEAEPPAVVKVEIADEDEECTNQLDDEIAVKLENVTEDGTADEILLEPLFKMDDDAETSEDSSDCKQADIKSEVADDDWTTDDSPAQRSDSGSAESARSLSARAREQLAMNCSVFLERLRDEDHETCETSGKQLTRKPIPLTQQEHTGTTYFCHICSETFPHKSLLTEHLRTHDVKKIYARDLYNKRLIEKEKNSNRVKQKQVNSGYTHMCDTCNKLFPYKCRLIKHIRVHTGEKPYTCDQCKRKFNRKGHLRRHIKIHTGQKPYICDICDRPFNRKCHLKRHITIHTGQKPYTCEICDRRFSRKDYLDTHFKTHTVHTC